MNNTAKIFVQPCSLSTSVASNLFSAHVYIPTEGIYAYPHKLQVELWSTLTSPDWNAVTFQEDTQRQVFGRSNGIKFRVFKLEYPLDNIKPGWYEFTYRIRTSATPYADWTWLNEHGGCNGRLYVTGQSDGLDIKSSELSDVFYEDVQAPDDQYSVSDAKIWYIKANAEWNNAQPSYVDYGQIKHAIRYLGIQRAATHWLAPLTGINHPNIKHNDIQYLLVQQASGHYVVFIPMTLDHCSASLRTDDEGRLKLKILNEYGEDSIIGLVIGRGYDPYTLTNTCMEYVKRMLGRNSETKTAQAKGHEELFYYDKLGYCTWEAFREKVNRDDLFAALQSLQNEHVPVGFVILDDGWQQTSPARQLRGFEADLTKFPGGLKELVTVAKERFPSLEHFGIWHTIWGYWNGIELPSKLPHLYKMQSVTLSPTDIHRSTTASLVTAEDIDLFYSDFYSFLSAQGINLVKVDAQASFDLIPVEEREHRLLWRDYQIALYKGYKKHMKGEQMICCMAMDPKTIFFSLKGDEKETSNKKFQKVFRNSDDFSPNSDSQGWHVYANTLNNLWTSTFDVVPDWDMFQSNHEFGAFHGASRAISGGPVYITDPPNEHNTSVLRALVAKTKHSHRILRCDHPALPSPSCIFEDVTKTDRLLKISNTNGAVGVLGLFNCRPNEQLDTFSLSDIPGLAKQQTTADNEGDYALFLFNDHSVHHISSRQSLSIFLPPNSFELATFAPITSHKSFQISCFGLINKYNGSRAIINAGFHTDFANISHRKKKILVYRVVLAAYGELGLYLESPNLSRESRFKVFLGSRMMKEGDVVFDYESGLLKIKIDDENVSETEAENIEVFLQILV